MTNTEAHFEYDRDLDGIPVDMYEDLESYFGQEGGIPTEISEAGKVVAAFSLKHADEAVEPAQSVDFVELDDLISMLG